MSETIALKRPETVADLMRRLGDIPAERVRMIPMPGRAKVADLLRLRRKTDRVLELVDGTLIEKPMGQPQACLEAWLIQLLGLYILRTDPGMGRLFTASSLIEVLPGLVRAPDVSFVRAAKLPGGKLPTDAVSAIVPDLVVEVISPSNTRGEMTRKLKEYFLGGAEAVWLVDPNRWTVDAHTAPDVARTFKAGDTLDGGTLLPGFAVTLAELFRDFEPPAATKARKRRKT